MESLFLQKAKECLQKAKQLPLQSKKYHEKALSYCMRGFLINSENIEAYEKYTEILNLMLMKLIVNQSIKKVSGYPTSKENKTNKTLITEKEKEIKKFQELIKQKKQEREKKKEEEKEQEIKQYLKNSNTKLSNRERERRKQWAERKREVKPSGKNFA
jgi:predicted metal-dependent peptidase